MRESPLRIMAAEMISSAGMVSGDWRKRFSADTAP